MIALNVVSGTLHAGISCTQLNKILMCLEIPLISQKMYKEHEQEVGSIIEVAAKESCKRATSEEKQLVLQKIEELREVL
ncbi:hypothetical protein ALC60_10164 [Trachymyrmex zeteki]|uniref:Mutator-like transposase domain-containing protein n=1 Tax=Mycetomoellerius zeteki TaxID=64791 RepID=A0A151WSZ4_9HYME|nr:hypothetical protein ALC60_10164 [Trachymyrmex zeteki]